MTTRTPESATKGGKRVPPPGEPPELREQFNKVLAKQMKKRVSYAVEPQR